MITNGYLTLFDLQNTLGATTDSKRDDYEQAIAAASRAIDGICSCAEIGIIRHFWQTPITVQRVYQATSPWLVRTGDFADATSVTVEVDSVGNGTWTPLNSSAWQAEPFVLVNGFPYTMITATGYAPTFPLGLSPRVQVTAQWGWAAIPEAVGQACQILAVAYLVGLNVISNEDGYSVGSKGPTNPIDLANTLLDSYIPDEVKAYRAAQMAAVKPAKAS